MKMRSTLLIGLAASMALVGAGPTSPAGAAAGAAPCGLGSPIEGMDGEPIYLTAITVRRGISCAGARKAAKGVGDTKLCASRARHNGWTVRPVGNEHAISARFTRGKQSFRVSSQGSC